MHLLRFGEVEANSSRSSLENRATNFERAAKDLHLIVDSGVLPQHNPSEMPIIDQWIIHKCVVPVLVGRVSDHRSGSQVGREWDEWMNFTAPLVLFSHKGRMARTFEGWYRLGLPTLISEQSLIGWNSEVWW